MSIQTNVSITGTPALTHWYSGEVADLEPRPQVFVEIGNLRLSAALDRLALHALADYFAAIREEFDDRVAALHAAWKDRADRAGADATTPRGGDATTSL